ncbi:MAG: hypothetical protein ABL921_07305 [Pirellula sp.]
MSLSRLFCFVVVTAFATGCSSGRYPVTGTVRYPDGSPVTAGAVIAEATIDGKLVGVQANIEPDGSFELGGTSAGDGALPGSYRAAIVPEALPDGEAGAGKVPAVEAKASNFETSGIRFEVKPEPNKVEITVNKPKSK